MIKLYRYDPDKGIIEGEAERETEHFWIFKERRESKAPGRYLEYTWFKTPNEAITEFVKRQAKLRDKHLQWAQACQDKIDKASGFLLSLTGERYET
jgi:hypothetical protein